MITLLNSLVLAIAVFFTDPRDANRLALINIFNHLLDLFESLIPSPKGTFLIQLIQSILSLLQSPIGNLQQLAVLPQQVYSVLASFFFSLIINPTSLQLLLNLLVQLINATLGPTEATDPLLPVHGVFFTFSTGPFVPSGLTVNMAGIYIADARVNLAPGNAGTFAIQVNGGGASVPFLNTFS
ncbi:TPA: collagen-like repeat preface domain-containing protein [Bacillus thuringiensis]